MICRRRSSEKVGLSQSGSAFRPKANQKWSQGLSWFHSNMIAWNQPSFDVTRDPRLNGLVSSVTSICVFFFSLSLSLNKYPGKRDLVDRFPLEIYSPKSSVIRAFAVNTLMFRCQDQNPSNTPIYPSIYILRQPPIRSPTYTYLNHPTSIIIYLYVPRRVYIFERSTQTFQSFHSKIVFFFLPDSQGFLRMAPRVVLVDPGDGAGAVDLHAPRAGAGSRGVAALLQPHHLGGRGVAVGWWLGR